MSEWEAIIGSNKAASYGSCVRSTEKSTAHYVKHYLGKSDTLQGLALKYNSTTDELRRINKLYSSDSIFLRNFLLVPAPLICSASNTENGGVPIPKSELVIEKEMDVSSFLKQLDSKITAGKKAVKDYKFVEDESNSSIPEPGVVRRHTQSSNDTSMSPATAFSHSKTNNSDDLFRL